MAMRNQLRNLLDLSSTTMTKNEEQAKANRRIVPKLFALRVSQPEVVTCNDILDRSSDTRIECHFIDLCVAFSFQRPLVNTIVYFLNIILVPF